MRKRKNTLTISSLSTTFRESSQKKDSINPISGYNKKFAIANFINSSIFFSLTFLISNQYALVVYSAKISKRGKNCFISSGLIFSRSDGDTGIKVVGIMNRKIKIRNTNKYWVAEIIWFFIMICYWIFKLIVTIKVWKVAGLKPQLSYV